MAVARAKRRHSAPPLASAPWWAQTLFGAAITCCASVGACAYGEKRAASSEVVHVVGELVTRVAGMEANQVAQGSRLARMESQIDRLMETR